MGARREFSELLKGMEKERVKAFGCEFVTNVPSASHMGGIWERQIRTIQSFLTAMLDKSARCKRVQFLANEFWQRWKREYLLNLQQRKKWQKTS